MLAIWIKSIEKTLIKITILVAILSVFMRIDGNIINYLIFLAIVYIFAFIYILFKMSYKIEVYDNYIYIKNFIASHTIRYKNIKDLFITEGYLQRKFNLHSIYIITNGKNYLIKDLPSAVSIYKDIEAELDNKNIHLH
jgi:membrane protein YdbS with pleckstrin-like domain